MTEHEELELLKKQYAALQQQRNDYKTALVELVDKIYTGFYNSFDLNLKDDEGKYLSPFDLGFDEFAKMLGKKGYFHLSFMMQKAKEYGLQLNKRANKAELDILLENWKLPANISEWHEACREDEKHDLMTVKKLAQLLIIFAHDFDFGTDYPSADRGIYSDAFGSIVRSAMILADIPRTAEGIEKALKEAYEEMKAQSKQ